MASHYDTLGVKQGSTTQEIRKAYLRRARALHPDRQLGRSEKDARRAEKAMQQVNVAWNVLSDPKKKTDYDKTLSSAKKPAQRTSTQRPSTQRSTTQRTAAQRPSVQGQSSAAARSAQQRKTQPVHGRSAQDQRQSRQRDFDEEPGDGSVSVWASMPVLLILGLLLGILIIAAFSGTEAEDQPVPIREANAELGVGDCFALVGNVPRQRSCASGIADGKVVEIGPDAGNCPANTQSLLDPRTEFYLCWARMIPGSSNTVPEG